MAAFPSQPVRPPASAVERRSLLARAFDDRSLAVKSGAAALAAVLTAVTVAVTGIAGAQALGGHVEDIRTEGLRPLHLSESLRRAFLQTRVDALADELIATDDSSPEHEAYLADVVAVEEASKALRSALEDPGALAQVDAFDAAWAEYEHVVGGELLELARADRMAEYTALRTEQVKPASKAVQTALDEVAASVQAAADAEVAAAEDRVAATRTAILVALGAGVLVALTLTLLIARRITRSVRGLEEVIGAVGRGDLTARVAVTSRDEMGRMATTLGEALDSLRETVRAVAESSGALTGSAGQLALATTEISDSADRTAAQAEVVAAASEQVSHNVGTVAAGAEEMGAAIKEISSGTSQAVQVAAKAVDVAQATTATVAALGESSREIGDVVKAITSIAEQTNLLALNATIEAARAGEMGKGFAVVAGEVKELAQQTARATEDIVRRVEAIQADTGSAVAAISEITDIIARIHDFQGSIASAVEEQTATTAEMSRNVGDAAAGTGSIAENIASVASATQVTNHAVARTSELIAGLTTTADQLDAQVRRFTY